MQPHGRTAFVLYSRASGPRGRRPSSQPGHRERVCKTCGGVGFLVAGRVQNIAYSDMLWNRYNILALSMLMWRDFPRVMGWRFNVTLLFLRFGTWLSLLMATVVASSQLP